MNEFAKMQMSRFYEKITDAFPGRLLFLGLQGSYRRGEQTSDSDLDVVVILDRTDYSDVIRYREMLRELPKSPQPCGFLCGLEEIQRWPAYDRFSLYYDTEAYYGSLEQLTEPPSSEDARESIRVGAANLLHELTHRSIYRDLSPEIGFAYFKAAKFLIIAQEFCRTGIYEPQLSRLETQCSGMALQIITALRRQTLPDDWAALLYSFCQECLQEENESQEIAVK
ncbi:MAG: nucleotidyltransferase domain-containing protein [Candidatus Merdivicinus sp.]|jgi:hypothetical protein